MGLVYCTTNIINNKKYIGRQKDETRKHYYGSGTALINAIKKYGKHNFKKEILISGITDNKELMDIEKYLIDFYCARTDRNYYNLIDGGPSSGLIGYKWTEDQKKKNWESKKRSYLNKERNQKISEKLTGRILSEETKKKISSSKKGVFNISLGLPVVRLDLEGNFIAIHNSISQACRDICINEQGAGNIVSVCKNNRPIAYGFKWMYKEDFDKIN